MINNSVMKCCICNNEKMGEFITINDNKYHLCCIENLQQENKELHNKIDRAIEYTNKTELDNYDIYIANILLDRNDYLLEILKGGDVDE